jgi:uncharacterized protein (DUF1778 family)
LTAPDLAVQWSYAMSTAPARQRSKRLEVRATVAERELFDRAAKAAGTDVTTFVVTHLTEAAHRILADRERFELSSSAAAAWDDINQAAPRVLPGLRRLFARPSPFDR